MQPETHIDEFTQVDSKDKEGWRKIIDKWLENQKVFCHRRHLNKHTLCYWHGKFSA